MEDVLRNVHDAEIYIDDIGIFNSNWDSQVKALHAVLQRQSPKVQMGSQRNRLARLLAYSNWP